MHSSSSLTTLPAKQLSHEHGTTFTASPFRPVPWTWRSTEKLPKLRISMRWPTQCGAGTRRRLMTTIGGGAVWR